MEGKKNAISFQSKNGLRVNLFSLFWHRMENRAAAEEFSVFCLFAIQVESEKLD